MQVKFSAKLRLSLAFSPFTVFIFGLIYYWPKGQGTRKRGEERGGGSTFSSLLLCGKQAGGLICQTSCQIIKRCQTCEICSARSSHRERESERETRADIYLYLCVCVCAWYECKLSRLITTRVSPSPWLHSFLAALQFSGAAQQFVKPRRARGECGRGSGGCDRELMYNSCGICLFGHLTASWNSSSVTHSHCFVSDAHFHAFPPFLRSRVTRCGALRSRMYIYRCECGCVLQ